MAFHPYNKYKILIDPKSKKTQGLRVGDIVRRQYFDNPNLIYSLMAVLETGIDVIGGEDSPYFVGALLEGDEPKNGEILDFVRITSLTDEDRGGALYLTASDSEAPYMDVIDGLGKEQSLLYPVTVGELSDSPNKSHYTCMGTTCLDCTYTSFDRDTSRMLRLVRKSGVYNSTIGLKQIMESVPEDPARLLLSFKVRGSKENNSTVAFGYTDGTETEGSETIKISKEWEYHFFLINIDFPSHYSRSLTIILNEALKTEGDWCEIAELNIVALSSVANFNLGTKARIGKITGVIDPIFGVLDGYGAYFQHIYATKNVNIAGTLTAGDENGFSSTFYVGKIHKNVIINSTCCEVGGNIASVSGESPTGIGNILRCDTVGKLLFQSAEWTTKHHNQPYCFSFWAKADSSMDVRISQNDKFIGNVLIDSVDWKRYYISFSLHGGINEKLSIGFESADSFYLSSPQLEAGSRPSQYQPTDGKLSYVEDYGAWFNKGGIGGTIQNPLLRLNEDGSISSRDNSFVINPDGTGHFSNGRFTWTKDTITLQDVTIRWEDLDEQVKENIHNQAAYSVYIRSVNGIVFAGGITSTTLYAYVFRGGEDITSTIPPANFKWVKTSGNAEDDKLWNNRNLTGKTLFITGNDVLQVATFDCLVTIVVE